MKVRKIIWAAVLVCCVGLGVWQRHNISIFWREYHSLWRDYEYNEYSFFPRKHIIPKSVARSDPEAAAVADIVLGYYEDDERLAILAESLLKYPDNEFFLFSCVNGILRTNELDQGVAVKLANKLIESDKDNSVYHYLQAATLIADKQDRAIAPALDEIKTAANCKSFYFPYVKYSQRTINTAEKASLGVELMSMLPSSHSFWYADTPRIQLISRFLLRRAHRAFSDRETEKGLLIDDAINGIGSNQLEAGHNEAQLIMNNKNVYVSSFGHWSCPETLELQRANITGQRARQNRLQLCPHVLPRVKNEETKERKDLSSDKEPRVTEEQMALNSIAAVHSGRTLSAMGEIWLVLVVICMIRGRTGNQKTGFGALLLFAIASVCYFLVSNWYFIDRIKVIRDWGSGLSYPEIMRPRPLAIDDAVGLPPICLFLFVICPILTALLLWLASRRFNMSLWWKVLLKIMLAVTFSAITVVLLNVTMYLTEEPIDLSKSLYIFDFICVFALLVVLLASWIFKFRLVKILLAAVPLGVLAILINPYAYISQIPMILFVVICTLIVLNKPADSIPFRKAVRGIFSKQPESAVVRGRAIKLLAIFLVVHWLIFIASVPTCARYIEQSSSAMQYSYPKPNLAPADEASYQQMLARFDSNDSGVERLPRLAELVMPQDLPPILNMFLNRSSSSAFSLRLQEVLTEGNDANSAYSRDMFKKKINDWNIIDVMQNCGRDTINILADSMENPERESVLVIRAKLGDVRVKEKLEELYALRIANGEAPEPNERIHYLDRPAETSDIICGLACISEPNEAGARFLDYVARSDISQLVKDYRFFDGIRLLPTTQARKVIKAYLAKAQDWQPPERVMLNGEKFRKDVSMALGPIYGTTGTYEDRDIAEAVLKIMLRSEDENIIRDWGEPWDAPQDFDIQSADLLKQGLASKNEQLRAWCVWQLRKAGYQFSEEELSRLLADESWKVRANAVVAGGRKMAERAAKDPNPFVRWAAKEFGSEN